MAMTMMEKLIDVSINIDIDIDVDIDLDIDINTDIDVLGELGEKIAIDVTYTMITNQPTH